MRGHVGMWCWVACCGVLAVSTAARAGTDKSSQQVVAELSKGPATASAEITTCQLLVAPSGEVRDRCVLKRSDLDPDPKHTFAIARKKHYAYPLSTLEWDEYEIEVRDGKKRLATFQVLELVEEGIDGTSSIAMHVRKLIADKDAVAMSTRWTPPAIKDHVPAKGSFSETEVEDRERAAEFIRQRLTSQNLPTELADVASAGGVVLGSAPGQRYTGKAGAKVLRGWKLKLAQRGGFHADGLSYVHWAVTNVVGTTKAGVDVPYVVFAVSILRLTPEGGSPYNTLALVSFAVPQ